MVNVYEVITPTNDEFFCINRNAPTTKHQKFQPSLELNRPILRWVTARRKSKTNFFPSFNDPSLILRLASSSLVLLYFSLQVTKSVMSLLNYYGWQKFSIIYEEAWSKVAEALEEQARSSNKTVNHSRQVVDRHKCCENNLDCCRPGYWYNVSFFREIERETFCAIMIIEKRERESSLGDCLRSRCSMCFWEGIVRKLSHERNFLSAFVDNFFFKLNYSRHFYVFHLITT